MRLRARWLHLLALGRFATVVRAHLDAQNPKLNLPMCTREVPVDLAVSNKTRFRCDVVNQLLWLVITHVNSQAMFAQQPQSS